MATIQPNPVNGDFKEVLFQFLKTPGIEGFEHTRGQTRFLF